MKYSAVFPRLITRNLTAVRLFRSEGASMAIADNVHPRVVISPHPLYNFKSSLLHFVQYGNSHGPASCIISVGDRPFQGAPTLYTCFYIYTRVQTSRLGQSDRPGSRMNKLVPIGEMPDRETKCPIYRRARNSISRIQPRMND